MKNLFVILGLALVSLTSYAQSSARPGYIVLSNDTLRGTVSHRESTEMMQLCTFQQAGSAESRSYGPTQISAYGFDARHFVALERGEEPQFMEVIATGPVRLLRAHRWYLINRDTTFVVLEGATKISTVNGRRYVSEDIAWLTKVKPMFKECFDLMTSLDEIKLSMLSADQIERKFSKIISQYNDCRGVEKEKSKVYTLDKSKKAFTIGLYVRATFRSVDFTSMSGNQQFNGVVPTFGVSFDYGNQRVSEHFRLHLDLAYTPTTTYGVRSETGYERSISFATVSMPIMLHYSIGTKPVKPFVRAGVAPAVTAPGKFTNKYSGINTMVSRSEQINGFVITPVLAAGIEGATRGRLHWYVEGRYEFSANYYKEYDNPFIGSSLRVTQGGLLVGVRF